MNRIKMLTSENPLAALASAGVVGFVLGGAVSYIYTKNKPEDQEYVYEHVKQTTDVDENQLSLFEHSVDDLVSDDLVEEIGDIVLNKRNDPADIVVEEDEDVTVPNIVSIFHSKDGSGWDWDKETTKRGKTQIYQIHKDEFFAQESGYDQTTLTYYDGDDILVDEQEVPIYNHKAVIGTPKFGYGSGDQNVAYIRNDANKGEYEIIKDEGLYQVEVLGQEFESTMATRDSKRENLHKFRDE